MRERPLRTAKRVTLVIELKSEGENANSRETAERLCVCLFDVFPETQGPLRSLVFIMPTGRFAIVETSSCFAAIYGS